MGGNQKDEGKKGDSKKAYVEEVDDMKGDEKKGGGKKSCFSLLHSSSTRCILNNHMQAKPMPETQEKNVS